jgi:hypothetical protein
MDHSIEQRLAACERENARLRTLLRRQNFVWILALLVAAGTAIATTTLKTSAPIRTTEVTVVDANGIVRARLGGDLPDAVMADGRVAKRGSKAGGLLIYDEEGLERGGYVTQEEGSNAMLTLDSKHQQAVLLVAAPDKERASAFRMWTGASSIELRSDSIGSRMTAADAKGVTFQQPEIATLPGDTCAAYKEVADRDEGKRACEGRFTSGACGRCLEGE